MKFLCLHGAIGNVTNFSVQLQPLEEKLSQGNVATFEFLEGTHVVDPPKGFEEYFGPGPHYRWYQDDGSAETAFLARIRELPEGDTPEDVIRALRGDPNGAQPLTSLEHSRRTLAMIRHKFENDPDLQGIIGYSEGASMAASYVLEEQRGREESGSVAYVKCAVFVTGWPPITRDHGVLLSDESETVIATPTLHVLGANDPYKDGALALYNVCDPETAVFFDTAKGHTIPRGGMVLDELRDAIEQLAIASKTS